MDVLKINARDNVAVALRDLAAGSVIEVPGNEGSHQIEVREDIPFGHKIALQNIALGDLVIKTGQAIGETTQEIITGSWVHVHNVDSRRARRNS